MGLTLRVAALVNGEPVQSRLALAMHLPDHPFACDGLSAVHLGPDGRPVIVDLMAFEMIQQLSLGDCQGALFMNGSCLGVGKVNSGGEELGSRVRQLEFEVIGGAIDATNGFIWIVGSSAEEQLMIHKFPFRGGEDPFGIHVRFF
jgi:hypothetical protein